MYNVKSDREHPVKCKRPIGAELVSIRIPTVGYALIFRWLRSPQLGAAITA
ncbi:MAG: hypothetical protein V7K90_22495 [Nostoc sp.]|uniref:hypothetical protein n=1 Tax=Nostoc sp. TaxID=1180 RepID=UPI002FFC2155